MNGALAGSLLLLSGALSAALLVVRARPQPRARLHARLGTPSRPPRLLDGSRRLLDRLGTALADTPLIGSGEAGKMQQSLYAAGLVGRDALGRFIAFKLLLAPLMALVTLLLLAPGLGELDPASRAMLGVGGALLGLRLPDMIVDGRAKARRELMDQGLPDALDLMVVCAEAGIGLEASLERVTAELRTVHPVLAQELVVTLGEMRLLPDRVEALRNMGERVRLDSVRSVATVLAQALRYGTPLARALRTLTTDLRLVRQTRMEERAGRLPVLITIPMIGFILPATTLVVAGPAFLQLVTALSGL